MNEIFTFTSEEREQTMLILDRLRKAIGDSFKPGDEEHLREDIHHAFENHQIRRDVFGFNPILQALQTAEIAVNEIGLKRDGVIAILMQTSVIDGYQTLEDIKKKYGESVEHIINGLLRIHDLYKRNPVIESENFRNLLISFSEDMRVILIMIADRVNVMRQIRDTEQKEAKHRVSEEASYLYAPLAHKLGLYKLKSELEDLSLKYLEHDAYYMIKEKLNATKASRDAYIARFIKPIQEKLDGAGLKYHMKGRTKSIHSIWQKMKKQNCGFEGVYDLFAIRIILDAPRDKEYMQCWQVFSIITDMYQPNPKRMRDWLSVPKSNGYESLHTTVLGPENKWVEVQIRTERMDDIAEHGLAAHWRYKGIKGGQSGVEEWLAGVRSALESGDDRQLMDQFKLDLTEDEVFVFTPKGDLFKLPAGATVLDFAYAIHTKVGNQCTGARIGGRNVTIRQKLASGDQVEIITNSNQTPKQDWLNIVTTSRARNKIKQSLKEMESKQASMAREELERKMKNRKLDYDEPALMHTMTRLGYRVVTDFYTALASGRLDTNNVLEAYAVQLRHDRGEEEKAAPAQSAEQYVMQADENLRKSSAAQEDVLVIDSNIRGLDFQMAKCCQPVYGDKVFGFVTSGGGIKIHRENCPNAPQLRERFGYRIVKAMWSGKGTGQYAITLHVIGNDDIGIVNNITSIISKEEKIQLRSISIDSHDGLFSGTLTVMLEDTARLEKLLKKIKTVKGIKNVSRS